MATIDLRKALNESWKMKAIFKQFIEVCEAFEEFAATEADITPRASELEKLREDIVVKKAEMAEVEKSLKSATAVAKKNDADRAQVLSDAQSQAKAIIDSAEASSLDIVKSANRELERLTNVNASMKRDSSTITNTHEAQVQRLERSIDKNTLILDEQTKEIAENKARLDKQAAALRNL